MGVFGKTSLGNESVYNSGFALTRYIAQKYGEDKLGKITRALGSFGNFTIDAAFDDVLGKDGIEIYNEWQDFIVEDYKNRSKDVLENLLEGKMVAETGFGNFYPSFRNDSSTICYVSNKSSDYFSPTSLYEYNLKTDKDKLLVSGIRSTYSWIPGKQKIIYSKITEDNPHGYNVHDLFIYDVNEEDETRLTHNLRANQPSISNDGKKIVFLFQRDGTTNIGIVDIDGTNFKRLSFFENGEQVYNPKFSNDDPYIIFDYSYHHTRDIAKVNVEGGKHEFIFATANDERNPVFAKNGNIIYSSDETGIFNIYSYNPATNEKKQLTNVIGGAFMPSVNDKGDITYAGYTSEGYKIFFISNNEIGKEESVHSYVVTGNPPLDKDLPNGDISNFDIYSLTNFNDDETPDYEEENYRGAFSRLTFFPFIRIDNYNTVNNFLEKVKPGLYVTSSDMLNRYAFFAGGAINTRLERDLFFIFDYRNKLPLLSSIGLRPELSAELYSTSREADVDILLGEDLSGSEPIYDQIIPTEVTYNLFEFDFVVRHRLFDRFQNLELRFIYSSYTATLGSFIFQKNNVPTLYPTTDDTYFIGRDFRIKYSYNAIARTRDTDINPIGLEVDFIYDYEFNKFNEESDHIVEGGLLKPAFKDFNFHRLELDASIYFPLWADHTLSTRLRLGSILGPPVADFFDFYLGGLIGFKAYISSIFILAD